MFGIHRGGYQALLFLVALYCGFAVWITGNPVFFLFDDRPTTLFLGVWLIPIVLWYIVIALKLMVARRPAPLRRIRRYTGLNRRWLARAALLIGAMALWASAFTILKTNIPRLVPYYADPALIGLDRALLGTDAWRLTHAVIGPEGTVFLDRAYAGWFFVLIGFMAWMIATRNQRLQTISLLTLVVLWLVLGVGTATALASVGPCYVAKFYGIHDFEPLMADLRASPQPLIALQAMGYLEAMVGRSAYAAGISAMPSMHVAMAVWFVIVAREGSGRLWPAIVAALFAVIILVGSVHLGWHYAADGLLSAVVTPLAWKLVSLFVDATAQAHPEARPQFQTLQQNANPEGAPRHA